MIRLITVDLGVRKIQVPVTELVGKQPGKTLLLTAGMDGDEYASIDAAYELIEEFSRRQDIHGNVITIPIVNIPGFEAKRDFNTLDGKFPKLIYPGKRNGTSTERLIFWLSTNYISKCNVWIDLHSGALDEMLAPYINLYETRHIPLRSLLPYIKLLDAPKLVVEKPGSRQKAEKIGKNGIIYIFTEAGCSGQRDRESITKHVDWVKTVMGILGMISFKKIRKTTPRIYRQTRSFYTQNDGLWFPCIEPSDKVKNGQKLGELRNFEGKLVKTYFSDKDGEFLWGKEGLSAQKGDVIMEIGTEEVTISEL